MVVVSELHDEDGQDDEQFHSQKHPNLDSPVLVEESMNGSFEKGLDAIHNDHQGIGRGEPEHVDQEIFCQSAIFSEVKQIAAEGGEESDEENQNTEDEDHFGLNIVMVHDDEVAET